MKNRQHELKRRLELVRMTVRELTSAQLGQVHGGADTDIGCADASRTCTELNCSEVDCCLLYNTQIPPP